MEREAQAAISDAEKQRALVFIILTVFIDLLGIGLHSYGFTSGVMRALLIFYAIELGVLGTGAVVAWRSRSARAVRREGNLAAAGPPQPRPS